MVRDDLPRGIQAAQIVHAAGASVDRPVNEGTHAVVLTVPSESGMARLVDDLRRVGVQFTSVFEPDPPYLGALVAIGLAPRKKGGLRRHLSRLPLLK